MMCLPISGVKFNKVLYICPHLTSYCNWFCSQLICLSHLINSRLQNNSSYVLTVFLSFKGPSTVFDF